jgi:Holliday junction DNA helicase RuvB
MDRRILELMIEKYKGGPVGLETIAALTGEDKTTIEDYYEPFLLQSGFLLRTQRGRMVTELGFKYMANSSITKS